MSYNNTKVEQVSASGLKVKQKAWNSDANIK